MATYTFSEGAIDDHVEKVGLDVRPTIDVRAERVKLFDYAMWLVEKWPMLFENTVQGPAHFAVTKKFVFPGKGEAECPTFLITDRGPVFVFPRKFMALGEETSLPDANKLAVEAIKEFRSRWPQCKHIRLGKVNEYVFDCGAESALAILCSRFVKLAAPPSGEILLRFNLPTDDYNRIITLQAGKKNKIGPEGTVETAGDIIMAGADFNNIDMSQDLAEEKKLYTLHEADVFCPGKVMDFLNGGRL